MGAIDAFHVRQHIYADLHTRLFHDYAAAYTRSLRGEVAETIGVDDWGANLRPEMPFIESGDAYVAREVSVMKLAESFYVAPMMSRLVTAAAQDWEADEEVWEEDWPTPAGFMYVPGGVSTLDVRGMVNVTVAFMWQVRGGWTTVTWWTD